MMADSLKPGVAAKRKAGWARSSLNAVDLTTKNERCVQDLAGFKNLPGLKSTALRSSLHALPVVILLSGCAVGPNYRPPDAGDTPGRYAGAASREFSAQRGETAWWTVFNDKLLTRLVEQTVRNNYDLKSAQAQLREARALYLEAGLNLAPTVTSHANYTEQKRSISALNNRNFVPRELKLYNAGFDASWELDLFGRVRRDVEAGQREIDAQTAQLHDLIVSLIAEVARNYFELRGLQNQLAVAQKNIANQTQTLAITELKLAAGRGTELDTARARAQLDATRASVPLLQTALSQALHRLGVLSGLTPTALTNELSQPLPMPTLPQTIRIGHPADLLRRRPDIRVAERSLAAATARIGIATADLFPRVTLAGSIALEGGTMASFTGSGSDAYSIGPKISWAALDLARVQARIKAADAHADADLAQYRQTVLNALEETENALVAYHRQRARQALLASAAQASEQAQQLAELRYQEGVADFLTALDSELRLLQDQNQLAQSATDTATALVAVYKALGGGWELTEQ